MKKLLSWIGVLIASLGIIVLGTAIYIRHCEWNPQQAAEHVTQNAEKRSVGLCAKYVREAIIAGGIPQYCKCDAWRYKQILPILNFKEIDKDEELEAGDIVVFQPIGNRKFGHIAMWNGKQWVSDFKQRNIIVHSDYTDKDCEYSIFRRR